MIPKYGKRQVTGKIKNTVKVEYDGHKFDSKLEFFFFTEAKKRGIKVVHHPNKIVIIPKFEHLGEKIREVSYTPDYYLPDFNILVEIKGLVTDVFALRKKVFLYHLHKTNSPTKFVMLRNQKEIIAFLNTLG